MNQILHFPTNKDKFELQAGAFIRAGGTIYANGTWKINGVFGKYYFDDDVKRNEIYIDVIYKPFYITESTIEEKLNTFIK